MPRQITGKELTSSKLALSVIFSVLMTIFFLLATYNNKAICDYTFYANSYSYILSKFPYLNSTTSNLEPGTGYFIFQPQLLNINPFKIPDTFRDDFLKAISADTTKKKNADSLNISDSNLVKGIYLQDTTKKIKIDSTILGDSSKNMGKFPDTSAVNPNITSKPDSFTTSLFDSIMSIDSTKLDDTNTTKNSKELIFVDSAARLEHFQYKSEDKSYPSYFKEIFHPLYGNKKSGIVYEAKIDSLTHMVIVTEKFNGIPVRLPIWISFEDYIKLTQDYFTRLNWEDIAHKYEFKKRDEKIEIGSLLSNITNIDIPIPENPLMSIFGDRSRINLRISGAVDIRGAFRSQKTEGLTVSRLGNVRNEPDFKQNVSIQVDGTVGDKLNIGANWDTQRVFDFENQLKISYKGYEDEIIQSIEAGNVGISTTSSLVGSSQALFGIKAQMNIGPLRLTTVASQKKSEKKEITVSGGSQKTPFELRAYQYSTNHFFLDSLYRRTWTPYYGSDVPMVENNLRVLGDIEVWVTKPGTIQTPEQREVIADIDLPALPASGKYDPSYQAREVIPGKIEIGRFEKLKSDEFILHEYTGYITLLTSVQENQAIAIAYRTKDSAYGNFSNSIDTTQGRMVLKLIRPSNLMPAFKKAWNMQIKCIYAVGGRGLKKETLDIKIWYEVPGQPDQENIQGISLLEILGLDKTDDAQTGTPDGKFDYFEGRTIDPIRGEIIFPTLEPFKDCFKTFTKQGKGLDSADSYIFKDVYDTTYTIAAQNTSKNRFKIKGEYSAAATSTYRLGMSVVPGSVQVFLGGEKLNPGSDYVIDEIGGMIIIKKEEALLPGANLQVKYEENDLISFASKTLLGATGEMNIGKNTRIGFGWINLVQQTLSDKVRLGEEPINNSIFGLTWSSSFDLPFITSSLNYLPFFSSNDQSSISLHGEAAYMLPDPNTKKSTIPMDNNEGVAYLDDFEGARQYIPLGTNYPVWHHSSPPADITGFGVIPDSTANGYKAKTWWYNIIPSDVFVTDIWPLRKVAKGDEQVNYLTLMYDPTKRGIYNYTPTLNNHSKNWGGIMRSLGSNANKLKSNNYTFIELWMKLDGTTISNGKLYIDLGKISEKVITDYRLKGRGGLHTEDGITAASPIINDKLDPGEDVGIDGLDDNGEKDLFKDPSLGDDPSGDNYVPYSGTDPFGYMNINGPEKNSESSELGRLPDTEDLNRSGVLDLTNSYFEYEILLDTTEAIRKKQIVGGGTNGWYQFRIPLNEYVKAIGTPSLDVVESARVWITGVSTVCSIKIAQFDIVGNQWLEVKKLDSTQNEITDSTFQVTVVSIEENQGYDSPPGVQRAIDRTRPDQNIEANEQALALRLNGVPDGESREAVRYYTSRPLDVFNYKTMRMFVWGDDRFQYIDTNNYDVEFYFRFGVDTLNYYEYRMPIRKHWDPENNVTIEFSTLTSVKQFQDTVGGILGFGSIPVPNKPGHHYQIRGKPTLTNITYFAVGIKNPRNKGTSMPLYGDVWVNELRLTKTNDNPGWAIRFDGSMKLSSLGQVSFNYSRTNPDFHSVDQRFGSRNDDRSWGLNASFALQNLLPSALSGSSLNLSYTHSESINEPRYIPGTDIIVKDASDQLRIADKDSIESLISQSNQKRATDARAADSLMEKANKLKAQNRADNLLLTSQTIRVSESFALPSVKINVQSNKWYITETINKLNFNFNLNRTNDRDPQAEWRKSWSWNFGTSYSTSLSNLISFSPFTGLFNGVFLLDQYKNVKFALLPEISLNLNANRSNTSEKYRSEVLMRKPMRSFTSSRSMSMRFKFSEGGLLNLGTDYSVNVASNLSHLETDSLGNPRSNKTIFSDIFFKKGLIDFGLDNSYNQDITINTKFAIPKIFDIDQFLEVNLGDYKTGYKWQNNFTMGALGKSAGWASSISPGVQFKLKTLGEKIFGGSSGSQSDESSGRRRRTEETPRTEVKSDTATSKEKKINVFDVLKSIVKTSFFDFESISLTFSQNNQASNSGIPGSTGFSNMWGRIPIAQGSIPDNGPSRIYQLGLISDPTGKLVNFGTRPKFPFFGFDYIPGIRVPNPKGTLSDNFSQSNNLAFQTSRSFFEGISLSLNWKVSWSYNRNTTLVTDSIGRIIPEQTSKMVTSNLERSYMAMPDFFIFKLLGAGGIQKISDVYGSSITPDDNPKTQSEKLANAFEQGFEFLPIMTKILGSIAPRANWNIRWSGLEKLPFLAKIATSVSLSHSYSSSHSKRYRMDPQTGSLITEGQRISYSFSPLLSVDISFKQFLGGNFGANLRFSSGKSYDLNSGALSIIEASDQTVSGNANFSIQGLQIPLFGLYLKNDVDISLAVSMNSKARKTYTIKGTSVDTKGIDDDNSAGTTIEPRFKYVLSSKVTGSIYYRYSKSTSARVPGNTINEAGLDVRISIN